MHELHWGSSEDRLSEAIAGCVAAVLVLWSCQKKMQVGRSNVDLEILATDGGPRTSAEMALRLAFTLRPLPHRASR
jgi:hypothetical protein